MPPLPAAWAKLDPVTASPDNVVERAIREGAIFAAHDLGDGSPLLFRWTHEALELECSMGHENLLVAAMDALAEIEHAKTEKIRDAFDIVLELARDGLRINPDVADDPEADTIFARVAVFRP